MSAPLGVLILHGFTGSRATVAPLVPVVEQLGVPWQLPQLRGHWTRYEDLHGVTFNDWLSDARSALGLLRREAERVVVVGLSMGGAVTLNLALERHPAIDSIVTLVPAIRFVNRLAGLAPVISRVKKVWEAGSTDGFADQSLAHLSENYKAFPARTFASYYTAARRIEAQLPQITTPALIIGAPNDRVIPPATAQMVYDRIRSPEKELVWFARSGHEMLLDCEAAAVAERVGAFIRQRLVLASAKTA